MTLSARDYHDKTSYSRHGMSGHPMDWGSQPDVFKVYPGRPTVQLAEVKKWPKEPLSVLIDKDRSADPDIKFVLDRLSELLFLTHALTAKARYGGEDYYYRSVASAGALYPFELYVGVLDTAGVQPGLYHHNVSDQALTLLRSGNIYQELAAGLKLEEDQPPVLAFFLTSIFFRSSWKYRDRAYRYHLLDTGHLLENLALSLNSYGIPFRVFYDFDDSRVNQLLALDEAREVCLACVLAWGQAAKPLSEVPALEKPVASLPDASRCASKEVDYPTIREIHSAGLTVPGRGEEEPPPMFESLGLPCGPAQNPPFPIQTPETMNYPSAVFSRRSSRNFIRAGLNKEQFGALLQLLCFKGASRRVRSGEGSNAVAVGLLADKVEGIDSGFFLLNRDDGSIRPVSSGSLAEQMAHACMDQSWLANCAVHFLFLTNLELVERLWGARGYRYAMMTAGGLGQRLYIGASSMQIGCCGIGAFYDDEAVSLLGMKETNRLLYLAAVGPIKKWSQG
jgi:SagB-type dehydrogenase family enzyme